MSPTLASSVRNLADTALFCGLQPFLQRLASYQTRNVRMQWKPFIVIREVTIRRSVQGPIPGERDGRIFGDLRAHAHRHDIVFGQFHEG